MRATIEPNDVRRLLLVLLLPFISTACDDVLDVEDPDVTTPDQFTDASALPAIRAGVIGDFSVTLDEQILYSGLLGDEWIASGTFPTRIEIDIRAIDDDNGTLEDVTRNLYRARSAAEFALEDFAELDPGVEGHAAGLGHVEPAAAVAHRVREVEAHPVQCLD